MTATGELTTYLVIGLWIDDEPLVAGVIVGDHSMADVESESDGYQRWATSVQAEDAESAESYAVAEMRDEQDDDEEDEEPAPCRTEDCDGDPDDGEGWDGYCGNCADRLDGGEDDEYDHSRAKEDARNEVLV
ncbi:hypothetical protein [Umezawaea sp. Da 62-37]|uniref:hypothetical protein n=1 Tax=Umezawaea sp. Da 62-37 TaxID=3075927 RepID=UPI0028F73189|nr:hypothetical protein [Umezawaea sp. Da 62-37]WNV90287.1 hypothetical protein RM788_18985 [Umezawaea sp. Da 62-37]